MLGQQELMDVVDAAFASASANAPGWPDPHPDRSPTAEEYSRVTDPARWRILGARVDAWMTALTDLGLASLRRGVTDAWNPEPIPELTRVDRIVPAMTGAVSLVVGRSRIEGVPDAGVVLGVGDPLIAVAWLPDCGCDACDCGSQDVLDDLDDNICAVVEGSFRYLWRGARNIMVTGDGMRRWSGLRGRQVESILADPAGWREISGPPWFGRAD